MISRNLYTTVWKLLRPLIPIRLFLKGFRNPAYRQRIGERFARTLAPAPTARHRIWIHAVSVGEVNAAVPLVRSLLAEHDDIDLLITTFTPTGSDQLKRVFADELDKRIHHVYSPYDIPADTGRFLDAARPDIGVFMETELWPNTLHVMAERGIPAVLANARLSERSSKGYMRQTKLIQPAVQTLAAVAAQTTADADRLVSIGVRAEAIKVTGSVKFDIDVDPEVLEKAAAFRREIGDRPVFIAGSTREGEEGMVLQAYGRLRNERRDAMLIIVPRHPERFEQVYRQCVVKSYIVTRRSNPELNDIAKADVYVGDTMGDLTMLYAASDFAYVGGSLVDLGGQNVLEACAVGVPVLFGPHTYNFAEICEKVVEAGAGIRVPDSLALGDEIIRLAEQPVSRRDAAQAAVSLMQANRGATRQISSMISELLPAA